MILQIAAKAVIADDQSRILLVRKSLKYNDGPNAGRYDFPGGRVEPGETYQEALKREVREEIGIDIEPGRPIYVDEWRPVIKGAQHQIIGIFSLCKTKDTKVILGDENDQFNWVETQKGTDLDVMEPAARLLDQLKNEPSLLQSDFS